MVSVKVTENIKVICFYRHPSADPANFSQLLEDNIVPSFIDTEIVFMGKDTNIDSSISNNVTIQNILHSS